MLSSDASSYSTSTVQEGNDCVSMNSSVCVCVHVLVHSHMHTHLWMHTLAQVLLHTCYCRQMVMDICTFKKINQTEQELDNSALENWR